eukprot:jgi/Botrbrau1/20197/Bobra.0867s0001.1
MRLHMLIPHQSHTRLGTFWDLPISLPHRSHTNPTCFLGSLWVPHHSHINPICIPGSLLDLSHVIPISIPHRPHIYRTRGIVLGSMWNFSQLLGSMWDNFVLPVHVM